MFSNFFLYPIGHLTHPPPSKVFLDFWNFFYLHGPYQVTVHSQFVSPQIELTTLCLRCVGMEQTHHCGLHEPSLLNIVNRQGSHITSTHQVCIARLV